MSRLDSLKDQFLEVRSALEAAEAATEPNQADIDTLFARAEELRNEIEVVATRQKTLNATADVLNRLGVGTTPSLKVANEIPSAAEYLASYFRTVDPHATTEDRNAALHAFHARTVAQQLLADTPGIVPVPVVGNIIKMADSARPVFRSFTQRPMPANGKTFERPTITQRVNVGEQAAEGDELTSRKMTLSNATVTKRTFGGTLELSQQDLDFTDPGILDIVIADFIDMYAEVTETAAATYLSGTLATSTTTGPAVASATRKDWVDAFIDMALGVYGACKAWPDTVWVGTTAWSVLASAVDADDKLIFPDFGSGTINLSAPGFGAPLGLRAVLAPSLGATKCIVGASKYAEAYEQQRGLLRGYQTANLMAEVAYYGYLAFFGKTAGFRTLVTGEATPVLS